MILRRQGNKTSVSKIIQEYFPVHEVYIEPFFGAGGMFFNKPLARYNIMNDIDSDVFNLYIVIQNQRQEFEEAFILMPIHEDLLRYWKSNKETDPIKKALRFIFLSNYTYLSDDSTLKIDTQNPKQQLIKYLNKTAQKIKYVQFCNRDFREFFKQMQKRCIPAAFVYCDPPYINTDGSYKDNFKEVDFTDLLDILIELKVKFACSEFDDPFVLQQVKKRGLFVNIIGSRVNLKNRRSEILITNYSISTRLF